jgi:hypothetical protein
MPNYSNTIIYKIEGPREGGLCYIGSSSDYSLQQCYEEYQVRYKVYRHNTNHRYYCDSFIVFNKYGFENCKMTLIENCDTITTRSELIQKIHYFKIMYKCALQPQDYVQLAKAYNHDTKVEMAQKCFNH